MLQASQDVQVQL